MFLLAALVLASPQTTWHVDASAVPPGSGTPSSPYTRVDFALSQPSTQSGDTVLVAAGVYPLEQIRVVGKAVTIRSVQGPALTVLEGTGSDPILTAIDASSLPLFEGFTLRHGRGWADPLSGRTHGGGAFIENSWVRFTQCVFDDCQADFGGAVAARATLQGVQARVRLTSSSILSNCLAHVDGGGIHGDRTQVMVESSVIEASATTGRGGAIFALEGSFSVSDSRLVGTSAGSGGAIYTFGAGSGLYRSSIRGVSRTGGLGGGYFGNTPFTTIEDCHFEGCRARGGAGAALNSGFISDCTFIDNATDGGGTSPGGQGGALRISSRVNVTRSIFLRNTALHNERSAGGAIWGSALISRSTFADNDAALAGASLFTPGESLPSEILGSIVARATGSTTPPITAQIFIRRSIVEGGFGGQNVIDADPLFWGPNDVHLLPDSPALSFGPNGVGAIPFDRFWCGEGCDGPIGVVTCVATPNALGRPATIQGLGSVDAGTDRVVLNIDDLPPASIGYVLASQTPDFVPMAGGSSGNLCVGGAVLRYADEPQSPVARSVTFRPVLTDLPGGIVVNAGETWYFQYWFRDTLAGAATSNFSPALSIQF